MWLSPEKVSLFYNLANIGLIVGLVIGVVSTVVLVWMGAIKESYLNTDLSDSRERTALLEQKTNEAKILIAEAEEKASIADKKAAEAILALEKFKAPREINEEEGKVLIKAIGNYKGQEYSITTFWDLEEPLSFSNRLHYLLQKSEWKFIPPGEGGSFLLGGIAGIQIWIHPKCDVIVKEAADDLIETLNNLNLNPILKIQNEKNSVTNKIAINVGTKR